MDDGPFSRLPSLLLLAIVGGKEPSVNDLESREPKLDPQLFDYLTIVVRACGDFQPVYYRAALWLVPAFEAMRQGLSIEGFDALKNRIIELRTPPNQVADTARQWALPVLRRVLEEHTKTALGLRPIWKKPQLVELDLDFILRNRLALWLMPSLKEKFALWLAGKEDGLATSRRWAAPLNQAEASFLSWQERLRGVDRIPVQSPWPY